MEVLGEQKNCYEVEEYTSKANSDNAYLQLYAKVWAPMRKIQSFVEFFIAKKYYYPCREKKKKSILQMQMHNYGSVFFTL